MTPLQSNHQIVINLPARSTVSEFIDEAEEYAKQHGLLVVRVVAYRAIDGVRGIVVGTEAGTTGAQLGAV